MKKIIIMLILLLVCFVPALAENTPEVIVDPSVKNVPNYIIDDIITEHPNAGVIHINKVETATPLDAISTCSGLSVYRYSNIAKNYRVFNGRWRTDFIISVARGAETKLSSTYSASVSTSASGSVTSGDDKSAPVPSAYTLGLNLSASVSCTISTERTFKGPSEDSEYNSRSFYVAYFGDIGTWTCTATRTFPASTVQMGGTFIEPVRYAEYSIDEKIK